MITHSKQPAKLQKNRLKIKRSTETGFPSPATDHLEERLNLQEHLIRNPSATFFCRVKGSEDEELGVCDGDLLVVDRSLAFKHHSLVIARVEGDYRVCRLWNRGHRWSLQMPGNRFVHLDSERPAEEMMWGVISHVIHSCI